jgi:hypothetical protein
MAQVYSYNIAATSYCYVEEKEVLGIPILMDGVVTAFTTPYASTGLTGLHNFSTTVYEHESGHYLESCMYEGVNKSRRLSIWGMSC